MRPWLIAAVWCAWIVVAAGTGYTPSGPRDKIADQATKVSLRADAVTLVSMLGAVGAAIWLPSAALPGSPWLGAVLVTFGLALTLGNWASVLIMVIGCLLAYIPRIKAEEAVLEESLDGP